MRYVFHGALALNLGTLLLWGLLAFFYWDASWTREVGEWSIGGRVQLLCGWVVCVMLTGLATWAGSQAVRE